MKDRIHRDHEGHGNMLSARSRISIQQKLCCDDGNPLRVAVMARIRIYGGLLLQAEARLFLAPDK